MSDLLNNALALHQGGKLEEAKRMYRRALQLDPTDAEALHWLGVLSTQQGRNQSAVDLLAKAIELRPAAANFHFNLSTALKAMGRLDEAILSLQTAVKLDPRYFDAWNNLAIALEEADRVDEAIRAYESAAHFKPGDPEILSNLGSAYVRGRRLTDAIVTWTKALQLAPDFHAPRFNRAQALLLSGDFARGWAEYESRFKVYPERARYFRQPLWDGSNPSGKTLLLWADQGAGDMLQFIRYAPLLVKYGTRVILECQPELQTLLQSIEGAAVFARKEALPAFDIHLPVMSLPHRFRTTPQTIPSKTPYLRPDPKLVELWAGKLRPDGRKRVGLVWAGRPEHADDRQRSIPLSLFAPLADVGGVTFYSFQKGPAAGQLGTPPAGLELIDLTAGFKDFSHTAALMSHMDLMLTVDTSVCHLAGALGRPVWTLVPFAPDFRWLVEREDTPWYPTMRLFRQDRPGDWPGVIGRVVESLAVQFPPRS